MRILWTINMLMPNAAKAMGVDAGHAVSWIDAMSKCLSVRDDIKLSIACPLECDAPNIVEVDNIAYYIFPKKNCEKIDYWTEIINSYKPDVIHAYGTEGKHNYLLLKNHNEVPILVSLQGIITEYEHHYYAGIDFSTMLRYTTLKDILVPTGFFSGRCSFIRRSKFEKETLKLARYVEGRSTWDRVSALNINPDLEYYFCPRMIRAPFYKEKWSVDKMERHSILVHQAHYPIKGLHFVLEALGKLKKKYPDVKLYVAGKDILHPEKLSRRLMPGGYAQYLKHLIKINQLEEIIHYTGFLSAEQLAKKLTEVNAVVIPSSIENAPNSLAEGEIVGTPTIATFVGGNMDMLEHNKDGFLYCYNEPNMLAEYLTQIFDSDELANNFSEHARTTARKRHNPVTLENTILSIYNSLISKNK